MSPPSLSRSGCITAALELSRRQTSTTTHRYEITSPGGRVEHWNEEAGSVWIERLQRQFPRLVWLNPEREDHWKHSQSCQITQQLIGTDRMFPLTLSGLEAGMKRLMH